MVLKEGRKGAEGDPESGEAGPSAERSEALLSGGRTFARVKKRGRAKPAGPVPAPSASTCRWDGRVRPSQEHPVGVDVRSKVSRPPELLSHIMRVGKWALGQL